LQRQKYKEQKHQMLEEKLVESKKRLEVLEQKSKLLQRKKQQCVDERNQEIIKKRKQLERIGKKVKLKLQESVTQKTVNPTDFKIKQRSTLFKAQLPHQAKEDGVPDIAAKRNTISTFSMRKKEDKINIPTLPSLEMTIGILNRDSKTIAQQEKTEKRHNLKMTAFLKNLSQLTSTAKHYKDYYVKISQKTLTSMKDQNRENPQVAKSTDVDENQSTKKTDFEFSYNKCETHESEPEENELCDVDENAEIGCGIVPHLSEDETHKQKIETIECVEYDPIRYESLLHKPGITTKVPQKYLHGHCRFILILADMF
ncbi:hypothetical protein ROZALSC1DRAFT_24294, partial [Rozella allomycis CSF55]